MSKNLKEASNNITHSHWADKYQSTTSVQEGIDTRILVLPIERWTNPPKSITRGVQSFGRIWFNIIPN